MKQQNKKTNRLVRYRSPKYGIGIEFIVLELDTKRFLYESNVFGNLEQAKRAAYEYLHGRK